LLISRSVQLFWLRTRRIRLPNVRFAFVMEPRGQ
jgi:hypothetical protein